MAGGPVFSVLGAAMLATASITAVPAAAAAEDGGQVADVVVTARQRPESLSQTPLALRVLSGEGIERLQAVQLADLTDAAPNFSIEPLNGLQTVLIRGAGGGGRNIGFGPRTAVYLDGVYTALPSALDRSLLDAERVEVLRGPQGALFGRNTVSGAVAIVSRAPAPQAAADVRLWTGSRRDVGGFAAADLPMAGGLVLTHLSALRETRDGFTTNLYDGSRGVGSLDLQSYRAAARLQASERLRFDLSGDYALDRSQRDGFEAVSSTFGTGAADPFAPARFQIDENTPRVRRDTQAGAALTTRYDLPENGAWTAITAYRFTGAERRSDNDYSPLDILSTDYHDRFGQFSQELRLASGDAGRLTYVAGVFYLHEAARSDRAAEFGRDVSLPGVSPGAVVPNRSHIDSSSAAAFANLDYRLAPQWSLSAGLRYNLERRRLVFDQDGRGSGVLRIASLTNFRDRGGENRATPVLSLSYAPAPRLTAYLRYAEGFKSGGWNVDFLNTAQVAPIPGSASAPFAFGPETVRAYEAGLKGGFWGGRAHADLTVFAMAFRGYQVNKLIAYPNGLNVIQLTNASSAHSSGVELSADVQPAKFLRLTLDAATLDAHFGAFPGGGAAGADASGNRLPFSPRLTVSGGIELTAPVRFGSVVLFVRERSRSAVYAGQENTPDERVPAYQVLDLRLSWRAPGERVAVALWARNLADARYLSNRVRDFLGTETVTWGEPRTLGVEVSGRF